MRIDRRAEELIQKHLDGRASEAELAELDRLLARSSAVADALWKAAEVDAILAMHWQGRDSVPRRATSSLPARTLHRRTLWCRLVVAAITAAALVLLALAGLWKWDAQSGHRVMAGTVEVAGVPVTRIAENDALRVVGNQAAVIRLAGGSRAELIPSTSAIVRRQDGFAAQVLELLEGGGRFHVPRAAPPLCVETAGGSVTAATTDFQVNLWPTQGKGDDEMQFRSLLVLAVAVSTGMVEVNSPEEQCVLSAGSQAVFGAEVPAVGKAKDLSAWLPPGDALGFTQKERPFALEQVLPGLTGAVGLNDEQKQKLAAAMEETINRREVRAAMAKAKLDPNATEAQKQEARRLIEQARAELQKRVAQILTPKQTKLIEQINAVAAEARQQTSKAMQDDLLAIKSDPSRKEKVMKEYQQRVRAAMESRVLGLLDADAQAALKKAAAAQAAAEKVPKKGPKSKP
jgi:ferric-dicitrate binding protein FerR (iron transport regulator)